MESIISYRFTRCICITSAYSTFYNFRFHIVTAAPTFKCADNASNVYIFGNVGGGERGRLLNDSRLYKLTFARCHGLVAVCQIKRYRYILHGFTRRENLCTIGSVKLYLFARYFVGHICAATVFEDYCKSGGCFDLVYLNRVFSGRSVGQCGNCPIIVACRNAVCICGGHYNNNKRLTVACTTKRGAVTNRHTVIHSSKSLRCTLIYNAVKLNKNIIINAALPNPKHFFCSQYRKRINT